MRVCVVILPLKCCRERRRLLYTSTLEFSGRARSSSHRITDQSLERAQWQLRWSSCVLTLPPCTRGSAPKFFSGNYVQQSCPSISSRPNMNKLWVSCLDSRPNRSFCVRGSAAVGWCHMQRADWTRQHRHSCRRHEKSRPYLATICHFLSNRCAKDSNLGLWLTGTKRDGEWDCNSGPCCWEQYSRAVGTWCPRCCRPEVSSLHLWSMLNVLWCWSDVISHEVDESDGEWSEEKRRPFFFLFLLLRGCYKACSCYRSFKLTVISTTNAIVTAAVTVLGSCHWVWWVTWPCERQEHGFTRIWPWTLGLCRSHCWSFLLHSDLRNSTLFWYSVLWLQLPLKRFARLALSLSRTWMTHLHYKRWLRPERNCARVVRRVTNRKSLPTLLWPLGRPYGERGMCKNWTCTTRTSSCDAWRAQATRCKNRRPSCRERAKAPWRSVWRFAWIFFH